MRSGLWLKYFMDTVDHIYQQKNKSSWSDSEWTEFMQDVMDAVGTKMNCHVAQRRKNGDSYEYLGIDAIFFDNSEYFSTDYTNAKYDPFVLPRAVVELENAFKVDDISYSLWKLLCIRSPLRVLICYQPSEKKVKELKEQLEQVIWDGNLMKGDGRDLLILIANEKKEEDSPWSDYFTVFEWRDDQLQAVKEVADCRKQS